MAIEIVDFPINNGDFPLAMLNYQRVKRLQTKERLPLTTAEKNGY